MVVGAVVGRDGESWQSADRESSTTSGSTRGEHTANGHEGEFGKGWSEVEIEIAEWVSTTGRQTGRASQCCAQTRSSPTVYR